MNSLLKLYHLFVEGISISDIAQWQNPGYALSVCSWLRLDAFENPSSPGSNYRRQFFKYSLFIRLNDTFVRDVF